MSMLGANWRQGTTRVSTSFRVFITHLTISQLKQNKFSLNESHQNLLLFVFKMIQLSFHELGTWISLMKLF